MLTCLYLRVIHVMLGLRGKAVLSLFSPADFTGVSHLLGSGFVSLDMEPSPLES